MRALEASVVVELGVGRQTELTPVLNDLHQGRIGGHRMLRPTPNQPAMKRNRIEHLNIRTTPDDKANDRVELVEFDKPGCHIGQIPALGRSRSSRTPLAI